MNRRSWLHGLSALLGGGIGSTLAPSASADQRSADVPGMAEWIAGATVSRTGIRLDMSELVENGHDVPIRVLVDSAMTGPERVLALSVWAPANPEPLVLEAEFSRHSPRAEVSTRIRLANSQTVVALARLENGSVRRAEARVVVALAACVEG